MTTYALKDRNDTVLADVRDDPESSWATPPRRSSRVGNAVGR